MGISRVSRKVLQRGKERVAVHFRHLLVGQDHLGRLASANRYASIPSMATHPVPSLMRNVAQHGVDQLVVLHHQDGLLLADFGVLPQVVPVDGSAMSRRVAI